MTEDEGRPESSLDRPTDSRTTVFDYLEALARRKWLAISVFIAVMVLSVLSIARTRPVYQARATMVVRPADQGDIFGRSGAFFWPSQPNTGNIIALLESRNMAQRVAESLPDPTILHVASVSVKSVKDADIIELTASAPDPVVAMTVANAYLETYVQYDLEVNRSGVTTVRQFIEDQLAQAEARLDSSERRLAEFKTAHELTDIGAETQALVSRQSGLAVQYQQATIDAVGTRAQLAQVESRIGQEGSAMAESLAGGSSPLVSNLQAALSQFEVEKTNLIIRGFDENSERIRGLDRQIDSTRARLRTEAQALVTQQGFLDPVGDLSNLFTLRAGLVVSQARQQALAKAIAGYDAQLARLPETERILAGLTRDVETGVSVYSLLSQRREEARIQEVGKKSTVAILDPAQNASQTGTKVSSRLALGLVLALALALGAVWTVEYFDTSIHGQRDLGRRGYSVLGTVPKLLTAGRSRRNRSGDVTSHLITHTDVESSGAEAFRMLRTGLAFASAERPLKKIAVTSPGPNEGKSTVAVNLASVLAQAGSRVLLVDGDLHHPMLHTVFKRAKKPGLSDLVVLKGDPAQAIFATGLDGLYCLPCGTIPPSPADLLTLNATRSLLERLASEYDYVVVDTPPVLVAADTPIIGGLADTTIMVVRAGRTALEALDHARAAMLGTGAHLSGLVLNDVNRAGRYGRYYYYYYKYHYRYSTHAADND